MGSANEDNKLVINKIGKPLLDDSYEDIDYIITKEEVERIKKEREKEKENEQEKQLDDDNNFLNTKIIIGIAGGICGLIIIGVVIFLIIKCCKKKNGLNYEDKNEGLVPGGF